LNRELRVVFEKQKITYINLFSEDFPETLLGPDKVHYNEAGHFQLAQKIEEKIFTLPVSEVQM
jgi:lysophospholipase L1-like esterase